MLGKHVLEESRASLGEIPTLLGDGVREEHGLVEAPAVVNELEKVIRRC